MDNRASLRAAKAHLVDAMDRGMNWQDAAAEAETDRRAVEAIGAALVGTGHPFVIASGTATIALGRLATEDDSGDLSRARRLASEVAVLALASQGVRSSVVRLSPTVHGEGDHGFIARLIAIAREKGVSASSVEPAASLRCIR